MVYAKSIFTDPEQVLIYLASYTHRVAISNNRIIDMTDGNVSFTYRDRKDNEKTKIMTLDACEFIRRFLLHVLPHGFKRIRHYGLLANRCKMNTIPRCRKLLNMPVEFTVQEQKTTRELLIQLTGNDLWKCPQCEKGTMIIAARIAGFTDQTIFDCKKNIPIFDSS